MIERKITIKPEDLSYCGVDCKQCDIFKATVHGDEETRSRAHKVWTKTAQEHWGMQTLDPAILNCHGCRTEGEDIFRGCRYCPMRRCAKQRNLTSCGFCPERTDCERLKDLFADETQQSLQEARKNLQIIARIANVGRKRNEEKI